MQAPPPSEKRKGSPGTGDKLGKVLFGQSQKGKSGRNLIMVRQNFNFISESGDPLNPIGSTFNKLESESESESVT